MSVSAITIFMNNECWDSILVVAVIIISKIVKSHSKAKRTALFHELWVESEELKGSPRSKFTSACQSGREALSSKMMVRGLLAMMVKERKIMRSSGGRAFHKSRCSHCRLVFGWITMKAFLAKRTGLFKRKLGLLSSYAFSRL